MKKVPELLLRVGLAGLGVFALATSLTLIFVGPTAIPGSTPVNSTVDNELRFYAVFWSFYGAAALWCLKDMRSKGQAVRLLALILFVCGLARTMSAFAVGLPHPLFVGATVLEYFLPPLFVFLQRRIEHPT